MEVLDGVDVVIDGEAVVVQARRPLRVLSSAVAGGGPRRARAIVNLHVVRGFHGPAWTEDLERFVRRHAVPSPWVGLLTAARTEDATLAAEPGEALTAAAVVTVGLSNAVTAGVTTARAWTPSTINVIVLVDARPTPAAMVNLVVTVTEVKTLALTAAGIRTPEGDPASGTSTDAVVVAATGRGAACDFGGPASLLGAAVARAARRALRAGIGRWMDTHP